MSVTYPIRPFRNTVISAKTYTAGTAYGTTAVHSIVSYALAGSITTTQFDPTVQSGTTTSANRPPPAVNGAKTDWGWRDNPAVSATEGIDTPAGNWVVNIRYLRSGVTGEIAIDGKFTVVLYAVDATGATQRSEIGRGSSAIVSSIATTAASTTVTIPGAATAFQGNDRVQYEVYFQSYLLGSPTAPVNQTNIWINFEGASGNSCGLASAPAYSAHIFRAVTTTPTVAATRRVAANRTAAVTTTPTITPVKRAITKSPIAVTTTPTPILRLDMPETALDRIVGGGTPAPPAVVATYGGGNYRGRPDEPPLLRREKLGPRPSAWDVKIAVEAKALVTATPMPDHAGRRDQDREILALIGAL